MHPEPLTAFLACFRSRAALVGLGASGRGDDAAGLQLASRLNPLLHPLNSLPVGPAHAAPAENVVVIQAGTCLESHLAALAAGDWDHVVFLDAIRAGLAPGSVVWMNGSELEAGCPQTLSHRIGLGTVAGWIRSRSGARVALLGVQVDTACLQAGMALSEAVSSSLEAVTTLVALSLGKRHLLSRFTAPATVA